MIVCVCHAVPENAVRQAAEAGLSAAEIALRTRAGTSCGCCRDEVERIVTLARPCQGGGDCARCPRRTAAPAQAGVPALEAA